MKIALIGAGSSVGRYLLSREKNYLGIYRTEHALSQLCDLSVAERLIKAGDDASLTAALRGCDAAVTLINDENPRQALASLRQAAAACEAAGVPQLIHLSSAAIYGRHAHQVRSENAGTLLPSWSSYATGKQWQESFLKRDRNRQIPSVVVLRPGLIWGPNMAWFRNPAAEVVRGNAWIAEGDGDCNLAHISLVANAISYFTRTRPSGLTFCNLYDEEALAWSEYYRRIAKQLGISDIHLHVVPRRAVPLWLRSPRALRSTFPLGLLWSIAPRPFKNLVKSTVQCMQADDQRARVFIKENGNPQLNLNRETWELKTAKGRPIGTHHLDVLRDEHCQSSLDNWAELSQLRPWMRI